MDRRDDRVGRLHSPSLDQFIEGSGSYTNPVILTGIVETWRAYQKWNADYFQTRIGSLPVIARTSSDGVFRGDPTSGYEKVELRMPFHKLFELMSSPTEKRKYYLAQNNIDMGPFSILAEDLESIIYIKTGATVTRNVWFGPSNAVTPIHFDTQNNFFCQLRGKKRFVLFSPDQTDYLYPFSKDSRIPNFAQVDIDNPDLLHYPAFVKAQGIDVPIEPGEILYIPQKWWHQVYSLSAGISVNFWWRE